MSRSAAESSPASCAGCLRGDLDAIVLKALERERDDRYPSVSGLAADLRRHLDGQAVSAHVGGRAYQLKKLFARHRVPVLATLAVILALAVATITTGISLGRARHAERQSQAAAEQTQAVNRILEDILSSPDPAVDGRDVTLLAVLDRTAESVVGNLDAQPVTTASLLHVLGRTYTALGVYERARGYLEQALDLRETHLGGAEAATVATRGALVRLRLASGDLDGAETLAERQLALVDGDPTVEARIVAEASLLRGEARYHRGKYPQAESDLRTAYDGLVQHAGRDHPSTHAAHVALGKTLQRLGQPEAAEAIYRGVYDARARRLGTDHPKTIESANLLANILYISQRFADAEVRYRDTHARAAERFGPQHPYSLKLAMNVANAVYKQGRYVEAEEAFREVLGTQRDSLGADHPSTLVTLNNLGNALRRQGRLPDAEAVYRDAMTRQRAAIGNGHDETLRSTINLVRVLLTGERQAAALVLIDEALVDHAQRVDLVRLKRDVEASLGRLVAATSAARGCRAYLGRRHRRSPRLRSAPGPRRSRRRSPASVRARADPRRRSTAGRTRCPCRPARRRRHASRRGRPTPRRSSCGRLAAGG